MSSASEVLFTTNRFPDQTRQVCIQAPQGELYQRM
jgi:hypothetical protein